MAAADLAVVDHFDNPTGALNTNTWTSYGGDSVTDSVVTVQGVGTAWGEIASIATYDLSATPTYEFKFMGGAGDGMFGIWDSSTGGTAFVRNLGGWRCVVGGDTNLGDVFTPDVGDIIQLHRATAGWEVYNNGALVSQVANLGTVGPAARIDITGAPGGGQVMVDYVAAGVRVVPEPATATYLGSILVSLLAYAWRKRR